MKRRSLKAVAALVSVGATCAVLAGAARPGGNTPPPDPAIAYTDNGIKVMNADGTNQRTLVALRRSNALNHNYDAAHAPAWSPDSTEIVFWASFNDWYGPYGLFVVPVAGGPPRLVVPSSNTRPDWSPVPTPDGQHKIVYTDAVGYPLSPFAVYIGSEVFLVNPDGSGRIQLTSSPFVTDSCPMWAPDGHRLAVSRGLDLVILDLDLVNGSLAVVGETVRASGALQFDLRWAKASEQVAFSLRVGGDLRVVTLDLDDPFAAPLLLTSAPAEETSPSFSPDDSRLVYHRYGANGNYNGGGIYTINADGTGQVRISDRGYEPNWRRTP